MPQISVAPLGRLGLSVIFAEHVVLEIFIHPRIGGHVIAVDPHGVTVEKIPIDRGIVRRIVLGEKRKRHGQQEGRVRTGANAYPPGIEQVGTGVETRPDKDKPGAPGFFRLPEVISGIARRGPDRVAGIQDDRFALAQIETVIGAVQVNKGKAQDDGNIDVRAERRGIQHGRKAAEGIQDIVEIGVVV